MKPPDILDADRSKHIYMPGKTQHGKTTLMFWMLLQDIVRGRGVCLMDGKGDFAPELLKWIPPSRKDDAIYLDIDTPVPLDFMGYRGEREKEALIGELKYLLTKTVETQHIPVIGANITDLLYTLFDYNENPLTPPYCRATFLDIYYFLTHEERRNQILSRVTDPDLLRRWTQNFPTQTDVARITTRMTPFIRSKSLRKIFGEKQPRLNIAEVMEQRKILIVNLGPMDDIRKTYGTLLLSKIREAAGRRATVPKAQRVPFYLYCDEFQEFQTSDFDRMLSVAGGLGLCLTLSHQYLGQLESRILQSIKGNVSTFIIFRLGADDAPAFRGEIPSLTTDQVWRRSSLSGLMEWSDQAIPFDPAILTKLPVGQVLYRAADGTARFLHTPPPPQPNTASYADYVRSRTVREYGCNTQQQCSTEGDGNTPGTTAGEPEGDIPPGPEPRVPPHAHQKKNARPPR